MAFGAVPPLFPVADDLLDVREAEAHVLELADPADADEGLGRVEAVAPLRPSRRLEEAELFVEVDRPDGLAGFTREIADLK